MFNKLKIELKIFPNYNVNWRFIYYLKPFRHLRFLNLIHAPQLNAFLPFKFHIYIINGPINL